MAKITTNTPNGNITITPNGTGEVDISKVDIDGGTIDGTTIGGTTPAAGTFTTFTSNGIDDNAASTALTIDASGNVQITNSLTAGTLGSGVVFPAGHIIQSKVAILVPTAITTDSTTFQAVSDLDLTLTRTSNTYVMHMIMGGGQFTNSAGHSMWTTVKRSDGSSYSGTNEKDLGASSNQGTERFYSDGSVLSPHSSVALDSSNISGSYTYRVFFRSDVTLETVEFSGTSRPNTMAIIFEYYPS